MSANDSQVKQLASSELDEKIIHGLKTALESMATPNVDGLPEGSSLKSGVALCAAVAMMSDGTICPLDSTQNLPNNNWLATPPRYILVKQSDHNYLIDCQASLGAGGAGSVYSAYIVPHDDPIVFPLTSVVVKVACSAEENALKNEVQFVTEDVVPYGHEGERILGVGDHAIAIFAYIPGQKLVQTIGADGIVVENALLALDFADRCQLAVDLCTKIHKMHEAQFCHLDLNWDNILVEIKDGAKYKASHIFDHGQSQYFSDQPMKDPIGKMLYNPKQANLPYGYGCSKYPLKPSPEIDIVPLGVICDILFAARKGKNPEDYNTFRKKQEALNRIGRPFRRYQTDAVVGAPFVIHNDFIDAANWNLNIATADRLNELIQVFLERMVSDVPDERPTAGEAVKFFQQIKTLNELNQRNGNEDREEQQILSYCEELAFQSENIIDNKSLLVGSALDIPATWYAERRIDLLLHMLSYPAYLKEKPTEFFEEKIENLISTFESQKKYSFNDKRLEEFISRLNNLKMLLKNDSIKTETKIKCVNAVMQFILLDKKEIQRNNEFQDRFKREENFSTQWTEEDQIQLNAINTDNLYKQLGDKTFSEIIEDTTLPEIFRKHVLVEEERLFLYRKTELKAARETIRSLISSDEEIKKINEEYSLFQLNNESNSNTMINYSGNEADLESETEDTGNDDTDEINIVDDNSTEGSQNLLSGVGIPLEIKSLDEDAEYKAARSYYEATLEEYRKRVVVAERSDLDQEYNKEENPVLKTSKDFLNAITPTEKQSSHEKNALTTLFVFQAQQLSSFFPAEGSNFPAKPQELKGVNPSIENCTQAIDDLAKKEQKSLKAAAVMAVGVLLGVTAFFATAVVVSALFPPAGLAFMGLAPVVSSKMLVAASAAIATLGYVMSVGIGCKIEDSFQETRVAAKAVHAVNAVQAAKKEAEPQLKILSIGKKPTSLLTRIGLFGAPSKRNENEEASKQAPDKKMSM